MDLGEYELLLDYLQESLSFEIDQVHPTSTKPAADIFFSTLYANTPDLERQILSKLSNGVNSFLVVAAPIGRGKTSLLRKCIRSLSDETRCFIFDFRSEIERTYGMPPDSSNRHRVVRDLFKEQIARQFLSDDAFKVKYIFEALMSEFYVARMQNLILKWKAKFNNPHIGEDRTKLWQIFSTEYQTVVEESNFISANISCASMIKCIIRSQEIKQFIVVLDNVDPLDPELQPVLFSVAIDIFHGGERSFNVVVAVREKNLLRFELNAHGGGVIEVVSLESHATERTRPIRMTPPTMEFVNDMLNRRYLYATERFARGRTTQVLDVFNQLKPRISMRFVEEKIFSISNNNFRQMLALNHDFISYMFHLAANRVILNERGKVEISDQSFKSYLYRWIYSVANLKHEMLLDVSDKYEQYSKGALAEPFACDIDLMVIAWLAAAQNRNLRVANAISDFKKIGVSEQLVLESIFRLYNVQVDHRYVELGDSEAMVSWAELVAGNPRIILMPLGNEFVGFTITKFEFLYHCLAYPHLLSIDSPEMMVPANEDIESKVNVIYEFLETMKKAHVSALQSIKQACFGQRLDWEEHYRDQFCVDGRLVLERIALSHYSHVKAFRLKSKIENRYRDLIEGYQAQAELKRKLQWPN
ncbi:MAG TPA: hypothetical protein VGL38_06035 [bacterium]|jgi:hypothetical protein